MSTQKVITLAHLYQREMNIYGDTGNRLILEKRLQWRGIKTRTVIVGIGDAIPPDVDIIIGGGGQDAGQLLIEKDLLKKSKMLHQLANDGVVMLMVCGLYQLFGRKFTTKDTTEINGIGLMPHETVASGKRLIGNCVVDSPFGKLVGYENHSGLTTLDDQSEPLGVVIKGYGNNGDDGKEGCVINNVFGTYMHGPLLAKSTLFADELLLRAVKRHGIESLDVLNDTLENEAARLAMLRPR